MYVFLDRKTYRFIGIPIKILMIPLGRNGKSCFQILWNYEGLQIAKEEKNKVRALMFFNFRSYYKGNN